MSFRSDRPRHPPVMLCTRDNKYHVVPKDFLFGWIFFIDILESELTTDTIPVPLYDDQFQIWMDIIHRMNSRYRSYPYEEEELELISVLTREDIQVIVDIMNPNYIVRPFIGEVVGENTFNQIYRLACMEHPVSKQRD